MIKRVSIIILVLLFTSAEMAEAKNKNLILAGDILQVALPVTAYAMTKIHDDDEGSKQFWTSFIITNAAVHAIKITTGRTKLHHGREVGAGAAIASIVSYYTVDKFGEANVRISVGASKGGALFSLSLKL